MRHQTSRSSIASRQERAAGRILDDEGLHGKLTDDEFQPLQEWAIAESDRVAASTEGMSDADADALIDQKLAALRDVIRAAGAAIVAHAERDAARRTSELAFAGDCWNAAEPFAALNRRLHAHPDLTGAEVAGQIVAALRRPDRGHRSERKTRESS